jgi:ribonuclease P protein component
MQTFRKEERLRAKKLIESLFNSGNIVTLSPFRIIWKKCELKSKYPVQIAISVPKKNFRKAVQRSRIKRRIREAYRKNKHTIYEIFEKKHLQIAAMLIYMASEELPYAEIEQKISLTLQLLLQKTEKEYGHTP